MNAALRAILNLDFPMLAVAADGRLLGASVAAEALLSSPNGLTGASLVVMLQIAPDALLPWLRRAQIGTHVRLLLPDGSRTAQLLARASELNDGLHKDGGQKQPVWLIGLHGRDSVSRQRYEREILLRIGSVPISELMRETVPLTLEEPQRCPITNEVLELVTRYLRADAALIFRDKGLERIAPIGQAGFAPDTLRAVLEHVQDEAHVESLRNGALGDAAASGLVFTFPQLGRRQRALRALAGLLPKPPSEVWLDGISGFGAVLTFFLSPPDPELRQFATEAHVRLGRHLESAGFSRDLYSAYRELQAAQEQIIQAGRLAALGEIAAGIAHELRQPVTAINNFVSNVFSQVESKKFERLSEKIGEYKERSRRNVERLMGIIDHLRSFARDESVKFLPVDLNAMLAEIRDTFFHEDRTLRRGIPVEWRIEPGLPTIEMDARRIEQVILNLMSNAGDALEGHADPRIEVGAERDGERVRIYVRDNGPGIPAELRKRVFDPFFTTKPAGQGTGIGLSISHGIVKGHNGEIAVENNPEGGATVAFFLPIRQPRAEGQATSAEPANPRPGDGAAPRPDRSPGAAG